MSTIVQLIFILNQIFFLRWIRWHKNIWKKFDHFLNINNKNCMHVHLINSCGLEIYYSYQASIEEKELLFIGRNFNKSNFNFFFILWIWWLQQNFNRFGMQAISFCYMQLTNMLLNRYHSVLKWENGTITNHAWLQGKPSYKKWAKPNAGIFQYFKNGSWYHLAI